MNGIVSKPLVGAWYVNLTDADINWFALGVTFSTRPLSDEGWEEAPFTSLIAAKDGEIIRKSPPHGNEYIYNQNDYRMVYMDFANL